jgi:hypothetical protein
LKTTCGSEAPHRAYVSVGAAASIFAIEVSVDINTIRTVKPPLKKIFILGHTQHIQINCDACNF